MRHAGLLAALLASCPAAARADTITLGGSDGHGMPWPFASGVRFQQVFDSSLFNGTWDITGVTFFNRVPHSAEDFVEPAQYQFFLSTTATSSATLTTSYDSNLGSTTAHVLSWTVDDFSVDFDDSLSLSFTTPFFFDPRSGNLLLDVRKNTSAEHGDGPIYVDGAVDSVAGVSLVGNILARPPFAAEEHILLRNSGILLAFTGTFRPFVTDPAPVPEPASIILVGGGLAALLRRRATRRQRLPCRE